MFIHVLLILLFSISPFYALAADPDIRGQVVTVRHCDELAVRHQSKIIAVRIAGINCPARKQPFAAEAKSFVGRMVYKQTLTIKPVGHDRQRRVWGDVFLADGRSLAYEMVKAGWAQVSASAVNERLSELEQDARRAKLGMWDETRAVINETARSRAKHAAH